jgi:hypothetical protein
VAATNTLAYSAAVLMTAVKSFIVEIAGVLLAKCEHNWQRDKETKKK